MANLLQTSMGRLLPLLKDREPRLEKYIELKTTKRRFRPGELAKFYLQCYLVGIGNLVIGHRDAMDVVHTMEPKSIEAELKGDFNPVNRLGRAYNILSVLLEYFRGSGGPGSPDSKFELVDDQDGVKLFAPPLAESSIPSGPRKGGKKKKKGKGNERGEEKEEGEGETSNRQRQVRPNLVKTRGLKRLQSEAVTRFSGPFCQF